MRIRTNVLFCSAFSCLQVLLANTATAVATLLQESKATENGGSKLEHERHFHKLVEHGRGREVHGGGDRRLFAVFKKKDALQLW
jgi:hypothetical protein